MTLLMEGLPYYRIQLDDGITQCPLEELLELATQGKIRRDTLIIPPFSESWQAADSLIELSAHLPPPVDPWDAWDSMGEALEDEPPPAPPSPTTTAAPSEAPAPTPAPAAVDAPEEEPMLLTAANILPLEPERPRTPAPAPPSPVEELGQVISFPRKNTRTMTEGAYALSPEQLPDLPLRPRPKPRAETTAMLRHSVQARRLLPLLAVGGLLLVITWLYVHEAATASFPQHPDAVAEAGTPSTQTPTDVPTAQSTAPQDSYQRIEDKIRRRISMDVELIHRPGDLEDAMFVELQQAGLRVASVNAEVLEWYGRQNDIPRTADIRLRLRSRNGEVDQELGTAAMVVGKYIARYALVVPRFEVILEVPDRDPVRWNLNPEDARNLYNQRVTLLEYLTGLR